jgi:hypothetical protein
MLEVNLSRFEAFGTGKVARNMPNSEINLNL